MSETTTQPAAPAPSPAPTPAAAQAPAAPAQPQQPAAETPPWGDDFDPARAWQTITNLREREKELSKSQLTPDQQKQLEEYNRLVEASKTEQQRLAESLETEKRAREAAASDALRYKVALEHGLTTNDFDLLGSGTEEEITARAKRVAELNAAAQAAASAQPAAPATPTPGQRPVEQLRPGATPTAAVSEDDANYQRLFGADAP